MNFERRFHRINVLGGMVVACLWFCFLIFPQYRLYDGKIVHKPLWNPPVERLDENQLRPEVLPNVTKVNDPSRPQVAAFEYRPVPNWIGITRYKSIRTKKSVARNPLMIVALWGTIFYLFLFGGKLFKTRVKQISD